MFLSVTFSFPWFVSSGSPIVLCPVNFPAEVHFTTIFALPNGKISEVGGCGSSSYPVKFHPCLKFSKDAKMFAKLAPLRKS